MLKVVADDAVREDLAAGLDEIVREGARRMLAAALEEEVAAYIAAHAWEPNRRIDYVFVGPPGPDGRGRVESARLAFEVPVGNVFASDHFGVIAVLRI